MILGFWFALPGLTYYAARPMARVPSVATSVVFLIGMLACLLSGSALLQAEDDRTMVRLNFPKTDLREVLIFYGRLVRKPVLMNVNIQAWVTIDREQALPLKEAVELIRKTLLESYGIEMRDSDRGEVLVTWSSDPKYPRHSDVPKKESDRDSFNVNGTQVRKRTVPLLEPEGSK